MQLQVGARRVEITNPGKVYYPATGTTKSDILRYYSDVAPWLLPHIALRPLNLKRYPEGVTEQPFYQKECPGHRPEWFPTVRVAHRDRPGAVTHCMVDDLASLLWIVNTGDLELHPLLSLGRDVETPTQVVFDLDPGPGVDLGDCCRLALRLREVLASVGLRCYAKAAGSKGLHVHAPLNTPTTFDATKSFSRAVAELLEREAPKRVTSNMNKQERRGRVFVDWSQNSRHKSTVAPFSLRGTPRPQVACPVTWDEVSAGADVPQQLVFSPDDVVRRLQAHGDPMAAMATLQQKLPEPGRASS